MIKVERLSYTYPEGDRPALRELSLTINRGEFVLLAGPSGAGKSTMLKALCGLVPHFTGGTIAGKLAVLDCDPIVDGPQRMSQHVGLVFQNPEAQSVLDHVEAEIAFALENAAIPPQEMRIRVEEVLNLLELAPLRQRPLHTLSGGERQRVAIASALALRPNILALDEPTSQLDPQAATDVLNALARLNEDLGITIVLAEHRLERVLRYVERVVALEDGMIVADDTVPHVLERLSQLPPLSRLGKALGWHPLPITVKQGQAFARRLASQPANGKTQKASEDAQGTPFLRTPVPKESVLEAKGVHVAYGRKPVLQGVNLAVRSGEAVVLMGRNGSGKTTLLKCLVGLLRPHKGEIVIEGQDIRNLDVAAICRHVAYLPQASDDLLFAETVRDELLTTLQNHHLSTQANRVDKVLQQLDLSQQANQYPRDLSVGERQRVALGAVTVTEPALLLLDEPTRGLDYKAKEKLVSMWQQWREKGIGLLMVTHDVELTAQIADRVLVLSDGEVIADGPAVDVLSGSPLFAPQIARLFPGRQWLTVNDALNGLGVTGEFVRDRQVDAD